ncbi:MAG: hypothetical protein M3Q75_01040 [Gemmatimonadota bacterium]|nr:hypothetical protein [Gemmatimonadota bacterium]
MSETAVKDMTAYSLANLADCTLGGPDGHGAPFLIGVRDHVVEMHEWAVANDVERPDLYERSDEVADSAVPVYTYDLWQTFVDVSAFSEDISDYGVDVSDLDRVARTAVYMVAERLASALFEQLADDDGDDAGEVLA